MKAYQIKVTLLDVEPPVWRQFIVPAGISFERLHAVIQLAMGWRDCHLYEFVFDSGGLKVTGDEEEVEEYRYYQTPEGKKALKAMQRMAMSLQLPAEVLLAEETEIDELLEKQRKFTYSYDFGDGWEHSVELTQVLEAYIGPPKVVGFEGQCPPEDCGGPGGYEEFVTAWNDPSHTDHESVREWGEGQCYGEYDIDDVNEQMEYVLEEESE
ncbi:MAG: plasmid pRiA4b ORF-3 family protein [Bacillota bacterium]